MSAADYLWPYIVCYSYRLALPASAAAASRWPMEWRKFCPALGLAVLFDDSGSRMARRQTFWQAVAVAAAAALMSASAGPANWCDWSWAKVREGLQFCRRAAAAGVWEHDLSERTEPSEPNKCTRGSGVRRWWAA